MKSDDIRNAPMNSFKNKINIDQSSQCGCYRCLEIFPPGEIVEWTDQGQTAICPRCHYDCLLAENLGFPIDRTSLDAVKSYWFPSQKAGDSTKGEK